MAQHLLRLVFSGDVFEVILSSLRITLWSNKTQLNGDIYILFEIKALIDLAKASFA